MVKQLLTKFALLAVMLVGVGSAWAATKSVDITPTQALNDGGVDPIVIACAKGDGTSAPAISSSQLRLYQAASGKTTGNTITFSSEKTITSIAFTFANSMTADNGIFSEGSYDSSSATWSGSTNSVTLTVTGTTSGKRIYITAMTVSYEDGGSQSGTYTVTYDGNGNTSGSVPSDATEYDATNNSVTVLGNTGSLAKTGYTFNGWNTKADGTGDGFAAGNTFTISANTTLYAQWTANTYSVTLPAADAYGTYTMDATSPVAYGTTVELTYTPASGYDNYAATWSVNGMAITGNTFTMPDEAVTVTVSVAKKTTKDMIIDFEKPLVNYDSWTASNLGITNTITPHGGSHYGSTATSSTAYVMTKDKVNPVSLTCYVSKSSNNTKTSTWYIQVSSDGNSWVEVENTDATDMSQGEWKEFSADLSSYSDVYVRVYYSGSTAVRCIDDLTLTVKDSGETSIEADGTIELTAESTTGEIEYTISNPDGVSTLEASTTADWISNITVTDDKVTFSTTMNTGEARNATITLTYGSLTKDITVIQAKHVVINSYALATAVVPGRHYIVVGVNNGDYKAMSLQGNNNRSAVEITVNDGKTSISSDANVYEILVEFNEESGYYTLFDAKENGYLYAACGTGTGNYLRTENNLDNDGYGLWTISIANDGIATIIATNGQRNWMRYNSSNGIFSCYETGQKDVYLYEKVGDTGTQNFTVSINSACTDGTKSYGTFSAPFAFTVPSDVTVSEIAIENGALKVNDYAAGAIVPANTGVMISSATAGDKTFTSAEGGTSLGSDNCLRPVIWGVEASDMAAADASCKFYRLTMHNGTKIGFWWGAASGAAFDYDTPNRAYLAVPENVTARQSFWFDNEATGISSAKVSESTEQVYDLQGRSVAQPTKGLYIMNGKKVIIK
ncbi:MAG: InlB B-repeat-containing protein [Prevotella sp.]|nr:InlB B-repeat-containing protein [Prevotella sp.]